MEILSWKKCSVCKEIKSKSEFNKRARAKDGYRSQCRVCQSNESKEYNNRNRERNYKRASDWQRANPEKVRARKLRYFSSHPGILEKGINALKKWKKDNQEKARESDRVRRSKNIEKIRVQRREWHKRNPEKNGEYGNSRRARKRSIDGRYTAKEWRDLIEKHGNRCLCCGVAGIRLTADHVVPLALGGSNKIDNIQPLCKSCNSKKHIKIIDYR